jgi:hypothetical protein
MEKIRKLRLFQKQEYISLDYTRQDISIFSLNHKPGGGIPEIINRKLTQENKEPLLLELQSFLAAAGGREQVECSGSDGRKALSLALQILAQAEKAQAREFDRE